MFTRSCQNGVLTPAARQLLTLLVLTSAVMVAFNTVTMAFHGFYAADTSSAEDTFHTRRARLKEGFLSILLVVGDVGRLKR
jgi:hypothetical protein